ncbi:MAG: PQQ-binding-like beta-propeller repeat protein [Planctomycetaceae bacterium]|nr:PQQ-binding-like beta-propeller repeat protein [Planctomycetaceae bacterium]
MIGIDILPTELLPNLDQGIRRMRRTISNNKYWLTLLALASLPVGLQAQDKFDSTAVASQGISKLKVKPKDWPQWGGSAERNNVPDSGPLPTAFDVKSGKNIRWSAPLGSETEKLPTGRVHDWPNQGICCAPLIDGDRLWYVTSRGEVVCLDTDGFIDGENDGPFKEEPNENQDEADVIWKLDMMSKLGVSQHNMCSCSVTCVGDLLFVNTSNGVDDGHITVPEEKAPSFICLNRFTGEVLWTDNTPGANILHGQWSSPAYGVLGDVEQVIFGGGDGWLYSFDAKGENGKAKMLWKFDCNPKDSVYKLNGATRNHIIATPVIYDGYVYVAVGEDPEHGEGGGHLWCVDPTKRGDVSPTLVYNSKDPTVTIAPKRKQALVAAEGDLERDNPNSAAVWHYIGANPKDFEQTMHRTCGTVAIKNDLLIIADFSGVVHCLDSKTGTAHWTHDMLAASWASPLVADNKIYIGDEDGDILIFELSPEKKEIAEINVGSAVYTTPIAANGRIYIANRNRLFCIEEGTQSEGVK